MLKKGDDEIIALFKGDTEVIKLYSGDDLIYDADRIFAYTDGDTLIIETDRQALLDTEDDSLVFKSKAWSKVEFVYDEHKKLIEIQQYEC